MQNGACLSLIRRVCGSFSIKRSMRVDDSGDGIESLGYCHQTHSLFQGKVFHGDSSSNHPRYLVRRVADIYKRIYSAPVFYDDYDLEVHRLLLSFRRW